MSKLHFKTRQEGIAYLKKLGIDGTGFSSMHQMAVTAEQAEKRASVKTAPVAAAPKVSSLSRTEQLKASIKATKNPSEKADLFWQLRTELHEQINAEPNLVKQTELRR